MVGSATPNSSESFLPCIAALFYATFDAAQGSRIVHQVPEGAIAAKSAPTPRLLSPSSSVFSFDPRHIHHYQQRAGRGSGGSRTSSVSPTRMSRISSMESGQVEPLSEENPHLFSFDSISDYVIPQRALCGRLVTCTARRYKIIGFPVVINDDRYERNAFYYNVCFVFEAQADVSCYEPVVRKCARVLQELEESTAFLSSPETASQIPEILEIMYEDLSSLGEVSIPIKDTQLNLKVFPHLPNPPQVEDWMVPICLINLEKLTDDAWDMTLSKVIPFIDGINHVRRIAELADADPALTRSALEHLLYYQAILMIDIFSFSNLYAWNPAVAHLVDDPSVQEECALYVTRTDYPLPAFPILLQLYAKLVVPNTTVHDWLVSTSADTVHGIDARRFVTFGVIKGFLRRVHRWPILLDRRRSAATIVPGARPNDPQRGRTFSTRGGSSPSDGVNTSGFTNRSSDRHASASGFTMRSDHTATGGFSSSLSRTVGAASGSPLDTRKSLLSSSFQQQQQLLQRSAPGQSPKALHTSLPPLDIAPAARHRARTDSGQTGRGPPLAVQLGYPPSLLAMLDGTHHDDELCVKYARGWSDLERILAVVGGVKDFAGAASAPGQLGNVRLILK